MNSKSRVSAIHERIVALAPAGVNESSRDPESGCDHIWYRVRVPVLRDFYKQWQSENQATLSYDQWVETLDALYQSNSIEERQFAGMMLVGFTKYRNQLPLKQLKTWLDQLEGWKEVDSTCQSTYSAGELLSKWKEWQEFLVLLSKDSNINVRRASLVLLVKPIRSKDKCIAELAFDLVETLKHERDKLITKAISWLLRSAVSHHGSAVQRYITAEAETLPAIAVRETKRKLETGRK